MLERMKQWLKQWLKQWNRKERGVFYIGGNDILPPPLSPGEEKEWLMKLQGGEQEAKQARDVLIEHNLRLVVYISKKFENTGVLMEDLI